MMVAANHDFTSRVRRCTGAHLFPISGRYWHDRIVTPPARSPRTADAIREELLTTADPKAADERLLIELAANAAAMALHVGGAADRLGEVLLQTLPEPRKAAVIAKVLHDLTVVGNTLCRRVENTLATAASLRLQRRIHRGGPDGS